MGTSRRAKLVVLDLDDGGAITIHLKMTGQLFVVNAGVMEDPYIRLILTFADGRELWFRDIRKFGRVGVARRDGPGGDLTGELGGDKGFKGFGPEPLEAAFTARVFRKGIRGRKGRLKPLLLDQGFVAGVGNIYADEALWAARLHPLRSASSLRPADEGRLYREIRRILAEAVERRGSSIDDYTAPDGDGSMQERAEGLPARRRAVLPVRAARSGGSSSGRDRPTSARGASGCRAGTSRARPRSCGGWSRGSGAAAVPRTGPRWTEIGGGDGSLGTPTGSTRRAAGSTASRAERTKRAAATRRAAARAATGARPDARSGGADAPAGA